MHDMNTEKRSQNDEVSFRTRFQGFRLRFVQHAEEEIISRQQLDVFGYQFPALWTFESFFNA